MKKESKQERPVKPGIRFPAELHAELQAAAARNGRTLNAEVLARVRSDSLDDVRKQIGEVKDMLREVLDLLRK